MRKDTTEKLSPTSVVLHWLIGIAVIALLATGILMANVLPNGDIKWQIYANHRSIGILVLFVAALRILWRFYNGMPKPLAPPPRWQKILAHAVHGLLLLATLGMPISGIMMTLAFGRDLQIFGWVVITAGDRNPMLAAAANTVHYYGGRILIALVVIHILAAIKHHYIDKNATVRRIFGCKV